AILAALRQYAPLWLVQFPGLVSEAELERLQRQVVGATPARMLRELGQALRMLTADTPMVLVLGRLHWSDQSTLDLPALLPLHSARRRLPGAAAGAGATAGARDVSPGGPRAPRPPAARPGAGAGGAGTGARLAPGTAARCGRRHVSGGAAGGAGGASPCGVR